MTESGQTVVFEQPLNERVRTFLRLEFLFGQYRHHRADVGDWGLRAALRTLLDLLSVVSRSDLRTEILKELAEQHGALTRLQQRPGVDPSRLQSVLGEIGEAIAAMQGASAHAPAAILRDNEFLVSLLHRSTVPGGASAFDLPGFHYWLSQPADRTARTVEHWFADLAPYERAITLFLRLLRQSTEPSAEVARGGVLVHTPQGEIELVRVLVPAAAAVYPEISAGRHRFTVRFMSRSDPNARAQQATGDIAFQLQCCAL